MSEIKLRECPFCGGESEIFKERVDLLSDTYGYIAGCTECWCQTDIYDTEQEAAEAWNRRVTDEKTD